MKYLIYCDESRQTKDRYMVIGGTIVDLDEIQQFNDTMKKYREEQKMFAELKWEKVSNQKLSQYKRFIEYFFALNNSDILHFHSIIIDNHQINYKKFSKGEKESGFYKFYYQLLVHSFARRYVRKDKDDKFIIHLHRRSSKYSLEDLKTILNRGVNKRYKIDTNPFISIEPKDAKLADMLQLSDIVIGAIGFQKNGYDLLAHTKKGKKRISGIYCCIGGPGKLKR